MSLRLVKSPGPPLALDSLTVQLPPSVDVDTRRGGFQHVPRYDMATGELVSEKWQASKQSHGVNGFTVPGPGVGLVVDVSAKALGENYPGGIVRERLPQLADAINATGVCRCTPEDLLAADVKSADPTDLVHVGGDDVGRYLRAFGILQASGGFSVTPYDREGIALNRNRRGGRDRLILYDKHRQMTRTKAGRDFLSDFPSVAPAVFGAMRAERHARRVAPVRRCAGREKGRVSLADLYATARQPIADLYDEAAAPMTAPVVADDFLGYVRAGFSAAKARGRVGADRILAAHEWDLDRVEALLREADAIRGGHRNVSRELKHFREAAAAHFASRHDTGEAAALHALVLDFGKRLRLTDRRAA